MLKKIISALLVVIMCVSLAPAVFAQEINETESTHIIDKLNTDGALVIYSTQEITDLRSLELRAENGIDDLKQRSGVGFSHSVTMINGKHSEPKSTTQLLSIIEIDGVEYEQYVTTTIVDFTPFSSGDVELYGSSSSEYTKYNYHLISRIYYATDSTYVYYYFQHSSTVFQTTGTVTASPKNLRIQNGIECDPTYPDYYVDQKINYTNISNPTANNPYILNSPYSGKLIGYLSIMSSTATLTLSDGTVLSCTSGRNC